MIKISTENNLDITPLATPGDIWFEGLHLPPTICSLEPGVGPHMSCMAVPWVMLSRRLPFAECDRKEGFGTGFPPSIWRYFRRFFAAGYSITPRAAAAAVRECVSLPTNAKEKIISLSVL